MHSKAGCIFRASFGHLLGLSTPQTLQLASANGAADQGYKALLQGGLLRKLDMGLFGNQFFGIFLGCSSDPCKTG